MCLGNCLTLSLTPTLALTVSSNTAFFSQVALVPMFGYSGDNSN